MRLKQLWRATQSPRLTLAEAGEHVARTGLPARRQFFVVAEDRARAGGLSSLAKSVTRQLTAPHDLRASLVSWINFVFLPEAVNRCCSCCCAGSRILNKITFLMP